MVGCAVAPSHPPVETTMPDVFQAFGSFHLVERENSLRGMWQLIYKNGTPYRLVLYSSLGTLAACVDVEKGRPHSCKPGIEGGELLEEFPHRILEILPRLIWGRVDDPMAKRDSRGRITRAMILAGGWWWNVLFSHFLSKDGHYYPISIRIGREDDLISITIRTEEIEISLS